MAKRGYLIPDDWDGQTYAIWQICAPDSVKWGSLVLGAIYALSRARNYDIDTGSVVNAASVGREIYLSMSNVTELFESMNSKLGDIAAAIDGQGVAGCCPEGVGIGFDPPEANSGPSIGAGGQFSTMSLYLTWRCKAATLIWEKIEQVMTNLNLYNADTLFGGGIGIATGIVAGFLTAGPFGGVAGFAVGLTTDIILFMSSNAFFSFGDLLSIWAANKNDLICAMYRGSTIAQVKANVGDVMDSTAATALEKAFIDLILSDKLLNQLVTPEDSTLSAEPNTPVNCINICPNSQECDVYFVRGENLLDRGSGDLGKDGFSRQLASTEDSNGFHYISFQVADIVAYHFGNCDNMPAGCDSEDQSTFNLTYDSLDSGSLTDTNGSRCVTGSYTFIPSLTVGNTYQVSWVEFISNNPFTISVTLDNFM